MKLFIVLLRAFAVAGLRAAELKLGVASVAINPPVGLGLAGYFHERGNEGVLDDIFAKATVFDEDWTLDVRQDAANDKLFTFTLTGSKTGADGEGRSDARFVSKSGRVLIETNDWNVTYALSLAGIKPVPELFTVKWKVEPRFVDEFASPDVKDAATETTVPLASGLVGPKHTLEISGNDATPIAAIRVYRPALAARLQK